MKILSTADIHIHDYPRYNLTEPKFRLKQFITLAHRLSAIYKVQGCEMIVISGDSIQTAVIPPETQHVLKEFYQILSDAVSENGGKVIMQLGNHDRDSRAEDTKKEESVITLMELIPNIEYHHKSIIDIDDLRVGFQDFLPEHNLDWYEGYIDILFNHYTDMGPTWGGQDIDKSRFGVMLFGDIHVPYKKGNIVSIGNPIPHRLKDSCEGLCVIIDTAGSSMGYVPKPDEIIPVSDLEKTNYIEVSDCRKISFKWVEVINEENPFLRFYRPDNLPRKSPGEWKYDIEVPYNAVKSSETVDGEIEVNLDSLDVDIILENTLNDATKKIHTEVLALAKDSDISEESIKMDFRLIQTQIRNYRSIDEYIHNWNNEVIRISGIMGAGKSTVATAMMFCFFGNRNISKMFRDTADVKNDVLEVDQTLEYQGTFYRIQRGYNGKGFLKYWKSKDEDKVLLDSYLDVKDPNFFKNQQANKTSDIDAMIRRDLPFLDMSSLFYLSQESNGLFTDMKKNDRIEMISKLLGWNKIVDYSDIAVNMFKLKKEDIATIKMDIAKLDGAIELIENMGLQIDATNYQGQIDKFNQERATILEALNSHKSFLDAMQLVNLKKAEANNKLQTPKPTMDNNLSPKVEEFEQSINEIRVKIQEFNDAVSADGIRFKNDTALLNENKVKIATKKTEVLTSINSANLSNHKLVQDVKDLESKIFLAEDRKLSYIKQVEIHTKLRDTPVTETCESCGQDIVDELKLQQARQKLIENVSNAEKVLDDELNIIISLREQLSTAQQNQANKIDINQLNVTIGKLDAMNDGMDLQLSSVKAVVNHTETIQNLNNSITPYIIYSNQLEAFEKVIQDGLLIEQQASKMKLEAEKILHFSDEQVSTYHQRSELILLENQELLKSKSEADTNNKSLALNEERKSERLKLSASITDVEHQMDLITNYIDLTSFTGPIVQKILEKTSELLSTDTMEVKTIDERKNGNHKPDLTLSVYIGENWKEYSQLSGGQLFYADIKFILSLFDLIGGCGLCIFDESFKFFNPEMIDEIGAEIKDANIRDTVIITHEQSYIHIDKSIHAELNERGITVHS